MSTLEFDFDNELERLQLALDHLKTSSKDDPRYKTRLREFLANLERVTIMQWAAENKAVYRDALFDIDVEQCKERLKK